MASENWWCRWCQAEVTPHDVTNDERHDVRAGGCGEPVSPHLPAALTSNLESLLMAARSALRQSICPGCNRSGYRNEIDCETCRERTALCEQLLRNPATPRPHTTDCASLGDDAVLACDCGAAAHNDAIAKTLTPDETAAPHPDVLAMLKEANELCRSAHAVAERIATQYGTVHAGVNFGALHEQLNRSLIAQHAVLTKHGAFTAKTTCVGDKQ